jgi:hypothetical protein
MTVDDCSPYAASQSMKMLSSNAECQSRRLVFVSSFVDGIPFFSLQRLDCTHTNFRTRKTFVG